MSTLGAVRKGGAVLIGEFTIEGGTNGKVLLRALGSSLKDPTLELANVDGSTILTNDNWEDTQATGLMQQGFARPS